MLRCQAQLELTLMMCLTDCSTSTGALSDRSTFTSIGALSDRSMFTSTDARATDLRHYFFLEVLLLSRGVCVCKSSSFLPPYLFMVSEPGTG